MGRRAAASNMLASLRGDVLQATEHAGCRAPRAVVAHLQKQTSCTTVVHAKRRREQYRLRKAFEDLHPQQGESFRAVRASSHLALVRRGVGVARFWAMNASQVHGLGPAVCALDGAPCGEVVLHACVSCQRTRGSVRKERNRVPTIEQHGGPELRTESREFAAGMGHGLEDG